MFLQPAGLAWAAISIFLIAGIALLLELGIVRSLIWAALRAFLQLTLLGYFLLAIFRQENIALTMVMILGMTLIATHTVISHVTVKRYPQLILQAFLSIGVGTWSLLVFASQFVLVSGSWRKAEVLLPLVGLLLGNSLSGISLGLSQWTREVQEQQSWIETRLAHGASAWEAVLPVFRGAVVTAMTPVLNAMSVAGIVSFPGMMTGQLLAGADPLSATTYQIAALFLISSTTFVGVVLALGMSYFTLINSRHQLQYHQIVEN